MNHKDIFVAASMLNQMFNKKVIIPYWLVVSFIIDRVS
jgi:hypothetical protein